MIRVFPRKTKATPVDDLVFTSEPGLFLPEADKVHVSVTFTWDLPKAEKLAKAWADYYPKVEIGGPATGMRGEDFEPGKYLKKGYVITSRGCPNSCWFCSVWKREGTLRELPITEGWNVLDDNLLACSESHIKAVFTMLERQSERIEFTGGLEAARLQDWHVDLLSCVRPKQMFFAYDTPDDYEPLVEAGRKLLQAGFTTASHTLRAYVLIGYRDDTPDKANERLMATMAAGFMPMAMLYRDGKTEPSKEWKQLQRLWARPAIITQRTA